MAVVNPAAAPARLRRLVVLPPGAPVWVPDASRLMGAAIPPGGSVALSICIDAVEAAATAVAVAGGVVGSTLASGGASFRCESVLPPAVVGWVVAEVEVPLPGSSLARWSTTVVAIGTEVRAQVGVATGEEGGRDDRCTGRRHGGGALTATATPFMPTAYATCFAPARAAAGVLAASATEVAAAHVPDQWRRLVGGTAVGGGVPIFRTRLPSRAERLAVAGVAAASAAAAASVGATGVWGVAGAATAVAAAVPSPLAAYRSRLGLALCLEAEQMAADITRYDVCGAPLAVVPNPAVDHMAFHGKPLPTMNPPPAPVLSMVLHGLADARPALVLHDPVRLRPTDPALFPHIELIARVVALDSTGVVYLELPRSVWRMPCLAAALAASTPQTNAPKGKQGKRAGGGSGDGSEDGGRGGGAAPAAATAAATVSAAADRSPPPFRCHVRFVLGAHLDAIDAMAAAVAGVPPKLWRRLEPAAVDVAAADAEESPWTPPAMGVVAADAGRPALTPGGVGWGGGRGGGGSDSGGGSRGGMGAGAAFGDPREWDASTVGRALGNAPAEAVAMARLVAAIPAAATILASLNAEQRRAVYLAVGVVWSRPHGLVPNLRDSSGSGATLPPPFPSGHGPTPPAICVCGPPGTGKTLTLTAAITLAAAAHPGMRILATAPSHPAADVLVERLGEAVDAAGLGATVRVLRLNPPTRPVAEARPATLRYVTLSETSGVFDLPPPAALAAATVVVSTCAGASVLTRLLRADHFWGGVYVDEAAQALEPEALIPITAYAAAAPVVLFGDPAQLNADVRSGRAAALGLATSLMERIVARRDAGGAGMGEAATHGDPAVGNGRAGGGGRNGGAGFGGDSLANDGDNDSDDSIDSDGDLPPLPPTPRPHPFTVELRINYRARHPALLTLPSRMFYGGRLLPSPAVLASAAAGVPSIPLPAAAPDLFPSGTPLLFVGVTGEEERESERSPAVRNVVEAARIVDICARLVWGGRAGDSGDGGGGGDIRSVPTTVYPPAVAAADAIGIIAPFRLQVRAIRAALRARGLSAVKVGTVTDYQGQEGDVIIISTTVSRATSLAATGRTDTGRDDGDAGGEEGTAAGLTPSPTGSRAKAFNVAITRAAAGLVVVGHPGALGGDPYWGALLRHCVARGCYAGVPLQGGGSAPGGGFAAGHTDRGCGGGSSRAENGSGGGGGGGGFEAGPTPVGGARPAAAATMASSPSASIPLPPLNALPYALDEVGAEGAFTNLAATLLGSGDADRLWGEDFADTFRDEEDRPWRVLL
ncbi:hypothetical protein MMPV_007684 [Pyropia vietnamensis]